MPAFLPGMYKKGGFVRVMHNLSWQKLKVLTELMKDSSRHTQSGWNFTIPIFKNTPLLTIAANQPKQLFQLYP